MDAMVRVNSSSNQGTILRLEGRQSKTWPAVLLVAVFLVWLFGSGEINGKVPTKKSQGQAAIVQQRKISSNVHRELLHGVDVLWQAPMSSSDKERDEDRPNQACGILVVLHGCHHSATDFWSNTEAAAACQGDCLGLPEERAIVQTALQRGMTVVALSSQNRKSKCWKPHLDNKPVAKVLIELQQRWKSDKNEASLQHSLPPIIAFGASSGGSLVGQLDVAVEAAGGRLDAFIGHG